ncbi:T9SS type A sorting domain-containing protein [Candidatus Neomarinimicrobiota bacterium]
MVYDLLGREVVRLIEGYRDAGWQELVWNGRDARGREVPTGIYIARLITPQGVKAIKLVMMK